MSKNDLLGLRQLVTHHASTLPALLKSGVDAAAFTTEISVPVDRVGRFLDELDKVDDDDKLSPKGQSEARLRIGRAALADVTAWRAERLNAYTNREAIERKALATASSSTPRPDPEAVEGLLNRLSAFNADEVSLLYTTGTPQEQLTIEAAGRLTPRLPTRTKDGVRWVDLLPKQIVEDAQARRNAEADPKRTATLADVVLLKEIVATVGGAALEVMHGALARVGADVRPESRPTDPRTGGSMSAPTPPVAK
jgi:hypothetical protein